MGMGRLIGPYDTLLPSRMATKGLGCPIRLNFRVRQILLGAKKTRPFVDSKRPVSLDELGGLCAALNLLGGIG